MNVYDFDSTIFDGESSIELFFFYLKRHPGIIRFAPRLAAGIISYKRNKLTLEQVAARYDWIVKDFLQSIQDYEADAKEFWDKREHRLRPFYRELQRPDDLILSASPEQSLREVCKRLGITRYIGTVINEETKTLDFFCFRENKVKAFRERYPNELIDDFYTDSMSDKPLMHMARHVFLVKKNKITQIK